MTLRLRIFEIIASPANVWLGVCAWLCGYTFRFGPVDDDDDQEWH